MLRYHGGKWKLAPWLLGFFPPHRVYVEPFGGAASVLLRKPRSYAEVYNDLDGEIVNLFRVARDQGEALDRALTLTPYARAEYAEAWFASDDCVEQARRTLVRSFMGFASASVTLGRKPAGTARGGLQHTGFRSNSNRSGTTPAHDWANFPAALRSVVTRLQGVVIEQREAGLVMLAHDGPETLHYADPPYPSETRDTGHDYVHELSDDQHRRLAATLRSLTGMVVLSGYPCDLYDVELYPDWTRFERKAHADGARKRTEVVWLSPRTVAALPTLFNANVAPLAGGHDPVIPQGERSGRP